MILSNLEGQFSCLKPFLPSFIGDYNTYSLRCVYTWLAKHLWSLILAICRKWQAFGGYRQSRTLWKWQYLRNGARCYYTPVIWSVTWPKDSCHFRWLWMTLKVIRLLQGYSNAIRRTLFCATFRTVSTDSAHRTVARRQLSCFLFACLLRRKKDRMNVHTDVWIFHQRTSKLLQDLPKTGRAARASSCSGKTHESLRMRRSRSRLKPVTVLSDDPVPLL